MINLYLIRHGEALHNVLFKQTVKLFLTELLH